MTTSNPGWRDIYARIGPVLGILTLLIALFGAAGTVWSDHEHNVERDARVAGQGELVHCFDQFATKLAGGLPPVRQATIARDNALSASQIRLRDALADLAAGKDVTHDVQAVIDALSAFETADQHLQQVRHANPYPPAPSTFCDVKDPQ